MPTLTPEQAEKARAEATEILKKQEAFVAPKSLSEKQDLYLRLDAMRMRGEPLSPDEINWMNAFSKSNDWESIKEAMRICAAINQ